MYAGRGWFQWRYAHPCCCCCCCWGQYDGDLHGAQQHGEGTYYWPDRVNWRGQPYCLYTGGWAHGCMHGFGCEVGEEGTYVGEYANDERHGRGIFLYKDGSYYVGLVRAFAFAGRQPSPIIRFRAAVGPRPADGDGQRGREPHHQQRGTGREARPLMDGETARLPGEPLLLL